MPAASRTFTNKVSWRAFALFVGCALIPVSALAILSLRQVTTELHSQSERRLRRASKAVGLDLYSRLLALETVIGTPAALGTDQHDEALPRPFLGVALVTPDGHARPLGGRTIPEPAFSPEQQHHLATGNTLLSTTPGDPLPAHFFLSRAADRQNPDGPILHGEINPAYLWMMEDESALDPGTELIVLDGSGQPLLSSFGNTPLPALVTTRAREGSAGQFTWNNGAEDYLGSYWALFLKQKYRTANWVVVLSRPTADILAPIAVFKRTFLLVALLSLLVVLLLSFGQIRRIFQPLDRLHDATRRLALGHLDTRVAVATGDEFEDLASSFNQMAGQLGRQFDALAMRREITLALTRGEGDHAPLRACAEIIAHHLEFPVAGVWLTATDRSFLECHAIAGTLQDHPAVDRRIRIGEGLIGRIAANDRPHTTNTIPTGQGPAGFVAFAGHPLRTGGNVLGVLAVFAMRPLDVMDLGSLEAAADEIAQSIARRRVAEALRNSEEQVRQLQKMDAVGRLAGGIAHDFNNLLTVIIGYTQMMLDELPPQAPNRADLQIVRETASRAAQLTQQLLAFSRKQVLAPSLLDLNTIVAEMAAMLHRLIGANIQLFFTPAPTPVLVKVDRGQIEQVLMNLVVNARDAMPGGGRIVIETSTLAVTSGSGEKPELEGEPQALIRVTDTGIGMDATTQAKIFEPFFTTKAPGKGTGLGLATVYGIVTQSGGDIRVESEPGRGTSFFLRFPLAVGTVEQPVTAPRLSVRGSETVLVVEDEHEVRTLVEQVLRAHGYVVLSASRPFDALRIAEQHTGHLHLVLTDMILPEMDGAVLTERIGAIHPEAAILQMSGYSEYRSGAAASAAPAFLQKPFTPEALAQSVRNALDSAGAHRQAPPGARP